MHLKSLAAVVPPRLRLALGVFALVIVVGTAGYQLLAGLSFVDALYQTVTTLSTVGFRELTPFDTKTKLFTVALILVGVGTALYTLTLIIEQALENLPEGPYYADAPEYYLPPKDDVYRSMEALIYHFKIVMGEVPIPKGEVYHAVEGGNGELGFYLISDGGRQPYRLHFRRPCFIYYQAYPEMIKGSMLSDAILTMSSMNVIAGELDA